jgi:hypothetical protein
MVVVFEDFDFYISFVLGSIFLLTFSFVRQIVFSVRVGYRGLFFGAIQTLLLTFLGNVFSEFLETIF